jgi:hypothetical protein
MKLFARKFHQPVAVHVLLREPIVGYSGLANDGFFVTYKSHVFAGAAVE